MKNRSPSQDSAASLRKQLRAARLLTASAILGNFTYMLDHQNDMNEYHAIAELCDQYCLSILLNWIAAKFGFPVCSPSIDMDIPGHMAPLLSWPLLANVYPLYEHRPIADRQSLWRRTFAFLDQALPARLEIIGSLHEDQLAAPLQIDRELVPYIEDDQAGRCAGQFYTPSRVVSYCLERAFGDDQGRLLALLAAALESRDPAGFRIIDPACGTGNFLLGIMDRFGADGLPPDALECLVRMLHGRDLDGRAVNLARLCLLISCSDFLSAAKKPELEPSLNRIFKSISANVTVGDAVLEWCHGDCGNFDLVVGNPPYVSYGSRNQPVIDSHWQQFLKRKFPNSAEYKVRLHSVFQDIAIRAASSGGHVVLLVPDAFLTGSYYARLRQLIIKRCDILSLSDLPADTVPGAVVGRWSVPHYRKKPAQPAADSGAGEPVLLCRLADFGDTASALKFNLPRGLLVSADRARFQLVFSRQDAQILELIGSLAPLSRMLRGHTGIRARAGQKSIIAESKETVRHKKGLVSGSQVCAYGVQWRGHWLDIDSKKLYAGGFAAHVVESPKILVRQTGDRLIAAIDEQKYYHLNNLHSFKAAGPHDDLWYLLALLNSSFYRFVYFLKSREKKRALAQIDIEMVESMPLPAATAAQQAELARIAQAMTAGAASGNSILPLQLESDRLVCEAFRLTAEQSRYIAAAAQ